MSTTATSQQKSLPKMYREYVVSLQDDDGRGIYYHVYTSSADEAKAFACQAELAPPGAVVSVQAGDYEEVAA